ncbi:head-tail joining protein [Burkholderia pyrrocinia]|uniref:ATP-binding sugar transporter Gifsy-2 n=1 Tax=Burkholderia pyrrocinia TaxID=60550 RepID=A0ABZ3BCT8_BURPY
MAFRDLMAAVDAAVKRDLADDDVTIDGKPVQGMFAAPWLGPDLGTQRTNLIAPVLHITDDDAARVNEGSIVVAAGARYRVVELHPDGTGWTILILR